MQLQRCYGWIIFKEWHWFDWEYYVQYSGLSKVKRIALFAIQNFRFHVETEKKNVSDQNETKIIAFVWQLRRIFL